MPRGVKCRRVCFEPENREFLPQMPTKEKVLLSMEEVEALRLVDKEGLEQSQACAQMDISRGTLQRILYSARFKIADALTMGKAIEIAGGNYQIAGECRKRKDCCKNCFRKEQKIEEKKETLS